MLQSLRSAAKHPATLLNLRPHGQVSINKDAEIAHAG